MHDDAESEISVCERQGNKERRIFQKYSWILTAQKTKPAEPFVTVVGVPAQAGTSLSSHVLTMKMESGL
jgi:hypothetical protein